MKIWVDGQCFQSASSLRGIGRYVADLLQAMHASGRVELIIALNASMKAEAISARHFLERLLPGVRIVVWYGQADQGEHFTGLRVERMADAHILRAHINSLDIDVALSPSHFEGNRDASSPFMMTEGVNALTACIFHDAIPYRFPNAYLADEVTRKVYMRRFEQTPTFDLVLCNSEFTASEYRDIFGKTNALSISAGLSQDFKRLIEQETPNPFGDIGPYVLYVGGADWRKNLPFLIAGMSRLEEVRGGELKLLLAGGNHGDIMDRLRQDWRDAGLPEANLIFSGWVTDAELAALYRDAAVTVQPSLMEGFGLTAVEAMAAGSPFLSAAGGAVPEVVSQDDLLFDPMDPEDFATKVSRMLNDASFREAAIAHGRERLRHFTWEKSAKVAIDALEQALKERGPRPRLETTPAEAEPRILMDVTSTALSPVMSGIQRVMHRLSSAMLELNEKPGFAKTQLTFSRESSGWYGMDRLEKEAISTSPFSRIAFSQNDTYFLLDSSWEQIETQKRRLSDAILAGQQVVHGIHDLGPLTDSALTHEGMPPAFRRWFEMILSHATGLVCVSKATADVVYDFIQAIELPRPMNIGYFSLGGDFADVQAETSWMDFTAGRPTFLMVGTIEPRKAHWVALEAFEKLWAAGVEVNLLIIGKPGWNTSVLASRLKFHPEAEKRLFVRNGVSDAQLRGAYESAQALIMTSYLEGFGLPVAEAGRLGCPVILADIPVFREVGHAAPAARYFEPLNPAALADCVQDILAHGFGELKTATLQWPSWQESAQEIHEILYGGKWYKRYEPKANAPLVSLDDIGTVFMDKPLPKAQRACTVSYLEGPLLSDDGKEVSFLLSLRNDSDTLWSSRSEDGAGKQINLGSHIYTESGEMLHYENPRTSIPFILAPDQTISLPLRVSTDWLARGGRQVELEMVQENVSWWGPITRFDLLQAPKAQEEVETYSLVDSLKLVLSRGPFTPEQTDEQFVVISLFNSSSHPVLMQDVRVLGAIKSDVSSSQGRVVGLPDRIEGGGYGLMVIALPKSQQDTQVVLRLSEDVAWMLKTDSLTLQPVTDLETVAADWSPEAPHVEIQTLDLDRFANLKDGDFVKAIFMTFGNRSVVEAEVQHYTTALRIGLFNRQSLAQYILDMHHTEKSWKISNSEAEVPAQPRLEQIEAAYGYALPASLRLGPEAANLSAEAFSHRVMHHYLTTPAQIVEHVNHAKPALYRRIIGRAKRELVKIILR